MRLIVDHREVHQNIIESIKAGRYETQKEALITNLLVETIVKQKFSMTYEITLTFFDFIVQCNDRRFIQPLIESFKNPFAYQIKLAILFQMLNFMSKRKMNNLMKYIEELLEEDPKNTIVATTINPVRVLMNLYELVEIAETEFGFSDYISKIMKEKIIEHTIAALNSYDEPQNIIPLIESLDL